MYSLNMDTMTAAKSGVIEWNSVQKLGFPDGYDPVMALAKNHIHFLDVGGDDGDNNGAGKAHIFVIHCEPHF